MSEQSLTLGEAFHVKPVSADDFVLQLTSGVAQAAATVGDYVVTESLAESFDRALELVDAAVAQGTSKGTFVHGSFGSGKSHFMAVLDLLLNGLPEARALPALQSVVSRRQDVLGKRFLTVDYHLIGADSFEAAIFSGYLSTVARKHPEARPPVLHRSDALLDDARTWLERDPTSFLAELNGGPGGQPDDDGWGDLSADWTVESFQAAAALPPTDEERQRLVGDLTRTMFRGYLSAGEWLGITDGLAAMAAHAKGLGYDALVLFLDELVLWLAGRIGDRDFVSSEGSKVATLVEQGEALRDLPIISFVARQRDLREFLGERQAGMAGAEQLAVADAFRWWEDRFSKIELQAADLPQIAHKRLLRPRTAQAAAQIDSALAEVKSQSATWDALLTSKDAAGEKEFSQVFPFSPALVDTLVALSSLLQRERTALKVMAQLLYQGRDSMVVTDIIPAGDLYEEVVASGSDPLSAEMKDLFRLARSLYEDKLRPVLLDEHRLTLDQVAGLARDHLYSRDDRLARTLVMAALAPGVPALRDLTASRLAALNHGSVRVRIAGQEAQTVLRKVRGWAESVAALEIGDGPDPIIRLQLSGIDTDALLERAANEDNEGARRTLLRRMLFDELRVPQNTDLTGACRFDTVWRGSKRTVDVVFGNIRDVDDLPDNAFTALDDRWRLVVDFPFDSGSYGPQDDLARLEQLGAEQQARTVAWIPVFLTPSRLDDLGRLVRLDHLLGGVGTRFDEAAAYLPLEERPVARQQLENMRANLTAALKDVIKQAYGVAKPDPASVDVSLAGPDGPEYFYSLTSGFTPRLPIGTDLGAAMANLVDQMLEYQFPDHPRFEPGSREVSRAEIATLVDYVARAADAPEGRVGSVEQNKRGALRRVANPLGVGQMHENHFIFNGNTFRYRGDFTRRAAEEGLDREVPVARVREWLAPLGLDVQLQNVIVLAWAILENKEFAKGGTSVEVLSPSAIDATLVLRAPDLPEKASWELARTRAQKVFGVSVSSALTVANVRRLADEVRSHAGALQRPAADLARELETHADVLGLAAAPESPRLADARLGKELVNKLSNERDPLIAVGLLAQAPLGDEPEPVGQSLAQAHAVTAALKSASWETLAAMQTWQATGNAAAKEVLAELQAAARNSEAHAKLEPALREATRKATRVLTQAGGQSPGGNGSAGGNGSTSSGGSKGDGGNVGTGGSTGGGETSDVTSGQLDNISLDDLETTLEQLQRDIGKARDAMPGKQRLLHITWRLD